MWPMDRSVKIVKADTKPFLVTSNAADTLLYIKDMDLVTFFGQEN